MNCILCVVIKDSGQIKPTVLADHNYGDAEPPTFEASAGILERPIKV